MPPAEVILLPVRAFDDGKQRLADALSPAARIALNRRFFRHVFAVARDAVGPARCVVVSRATGILDEATAAGARAVIETGRGLNAALTLAAAAAPDAARVLALSCDLPFLTVADVAAMLAATADVVIAPDAAGVGTNALLTRPAAIPYRFGPASRAAHRAAAQAARLGVAEITRPGLAQDIDLPADLALLNPP